jgi:hypothetical protein
MQVHFCPEGATLIIHDTPKRSATMPIREGQVRLHNTIIIFCAHIFYQCFCCRVQAYNERRMLFRTSLFQEQSLGGRF